MPITLENVTHIYMAGTPYERTAIKNINLHIEKGEFVGIIGHTGSGKSTLIQHMNGLLKPSAGKVLVNGVDIQSKDKRVRYEKRKVGMVFQYPEHQIFEETVYGDIAFGPRNLGLTEDEVDNRVKRAMEFAGLDFNQMAQRSPFQLSGGQMRRVAIAGVIALEPDYLVLDEPSAGLDPRGRDEIFAQIKKLFDTTGIAVVLISHNMDEVARLADRLIVMKKGEVVLDGTPKQIFGRNRAELISAGLNVPGLVSLLDKLQEKGLSVENTSLTVEEAVEAISAALGRGK